MGIADNMKGLTENIIASKEMRSKMLNDLLSGTQETIKLFSQTRKKFNQEQAKNLDEFVSGLAKNVCEILKNAKDKIKEFEDGHKKMSEEQAKNLSSFARTLSKNTGSLLHNFRQTRAKTSDELKGNLDAFIAGLAKEVKEIRNSTNLLLNGYATENKTARNAWLGIASASAGTRKKLAAAGLHSKTEPEIFAEKKGRRKTAKKREKK